MFLIGARYRDKLINGMKKISDRIIWVPDDPDADPRLAGHIDLNVFTPDGHSVFITSGVYDYIVNSLTIGKYDLIRITGKTAGYPMDCQLCIASTKQFTLYNPKTCPDKILPFLSGKTISVNQGYTKCSVCIVSDNAIITSDPIIESKAKQAGLTVLKICPGNIDLDGFDYGFIGGSTFLINPDTMAFTGTLDQHPDKERILEFLYQNNIKPVYLSKEPLFDIGGAVILP